MNDSPLAAAVTTNNATCEYIKEGRYSEARALIVTELNSVKHNLLLNTDDCTGTKDSYETAEMGTDFVMCQQAEATYDDNENILTDNPARGNAVIIRSPIRLDSKESAQGSGRNISAAVLLFTLVYNTALSHHLVAMEDTPDSSKNFRLAQAFYELSYEILSDYGLGLPLPQAMALANNVGQIYRHFNNVQKADQCFLHVLSSVLLLISSDRSDAPVLVRPYVANILPYLLTSSPLPPAA